MSSCCAPTCCTSAATNRPGNLPVAVIGAGLDGGESSLLASAVIHASGTWSTPGRAGASGIPAVGEREAGGRMFYGMSDIHGTYSARYAGRKTMVVGSGDSAKGTLIEPARLAGDMEASRRVEQDLPETDVCSSGLSITETASELVPETAAG